jgi:hypothetical protein
VPVKESVYEEEADAVAARGKETSNATATARGLMRPT